MFTTYIVISFEPYTIIPWRYEKQSKVIVHSLVSNTTIRSDFYNNYRFCHRSFYMAV